MQSEVKKKLRVIVWDCEEGKVSQDFMTNSLVCGHGEEQEKGGHSFSVTYLSYYGKEIKIKELEYMIKGCRNLIKNIRREKEGG